MTDIIRTIRELRARVSNWRSHGETVALVPTMGDLHEGHLSLVRRGKELCARTIVSVFVNPTQFGPGEDFEKYPRREAEDFAKLETIGADVMFAPGVAEMYPAGFDATIAIGGVTSMLEGAIRPGHFEGVATVVAKLFGMATPDIACFGEKDYQQLKVIEKLVRDLDMPVRIEPCPIARAEDGLALSSRNRYLDERQRAIAGRLNRILFETARRIESEPNQFKSILEGGRAAIRAAGFDSVDYLTLVDAETLAPIEKLQKTARLLVVARLGQTRLLDNAEVTCR
jgi:pantoate--beta-alanine ligase